MTTNPASDIQNMELGINDNPPPPAYGASEYTTESTANLAPPPSYEDAAKDAPPSYNSIYGQIQDARKESNSAVDYVKKVVQLLLNTACVTIFMLIVLAIPVAMIVIGALYFNDCVIQPKIPIFLIVMGCVYILKNIADLKTRYQRQQDGQQHPEGQEYENFFSRLTGCFLIVFFIAGNVWIYSIYPIVNTEDPTDQNDYCNPILYYFSFWLMTIVYIVCALTCCCICCTASAAASSTTQQE